MTYMDYPDWFDTEFEDYDKPCPECGEKMRVSPLFDQGCYEGMVFLCLNSRTRHQWVFRVDEFIPPYWASPICPACESLHVDFECKPPDFITVYTCPECKAVFEQAYSEESEGQ